MAGGTKCEEENKIKKKGNKKKKPTCSVIAPETISKTETETESNSKHSNFENLAVVPSTIISTDIKIPSAIEHAVNAPVAYATGRVVAYATGRVVTCVNRSTFPGEDAQDLQQTQEQHIPCHINADQQAHPGDEGQIAITDMEMNNTDITITDNRSIMDSNPDDEIHQQLNVCVCVFSIIIIVAM